MKRSLLVISCLLVFSNALAAGTQAIFSLKEQGFRDTLLANVIAQKTQNETFNPLQEYTLSATDYGISQSYGLTPNKLFDCKSFKCIVLTVPNNVLKNTLKMDFLNTQPYALLGEYKVLYAGITDPVPLVDIRKNSDSYTFYLDSPYGYSSGETRLIPVNGYNN